MLITVTVHRARELRPNGGFFSSLLALGSRGDGGVRCYGRCTDISQRARVRAEAQSGRRAACDVGAGGETTTGIGVISADQGRERSVRRATMSTAMTKSKKVKSKLTARRAPDEWKRTRAHSGGPSRAPVWDEYDSHSSPATITLRSPPPSAVPPASVIVLLELRSDTGTDSNTEAAHAAAGASAARATPFGMMTSDDGNSVPSSSSSSSAAEVPLGLAIADLGVMAIERRLGKAIWLPLDPVGALQVTVTVARPLPSPSLVRSPALAHPALAHAAAQAQFQARAKAWAQAAPLRVVTVRTVLRKTAVGLGLSFREAKSGRSVGAGGSLAADAENTGERAVLTAGLLGAASAVAAGAGAGVGGQVGTEVGCVISRLPRNAAGNTVRSNAEVRPGDRLVSVTSAHLADMVSASPCDHSSLAHSQSHVSIDNDTGPRNPAALNVSEAPWHEVLDTIKQLSIGTSVVFTFKRLAAHRGPPFSPCSWRPATLPNSAALQAKAVATAAATAVMTERLSPSVHNAIVTAESRADGTHDRSGRGKGCGSDVVEGFVCPLCHKTLADEGRLMQHHAMCRWRMRQRKQSARHGRVGGSGGGSYGQGSAVLDDDDLDELDDFEFEDGGAAGARGVGGASGKAITLAQNARRHTSATSFGLSSRSHTSAVTSSELGVLLWVTVFEARQLKDVQLMGTMDPYVVATLQYSSSYPSTYGAAVQAGRPPNVPRRRAAPTVPGAPLLSTTAHKGGACAPIWTEQAGRRMGFWFPRAADLPLAAKLEVWDEGVALDSRVGTAALHVGGAALARSPTLREQLAVKQWVPLDTGGAILCSVRLQRSVPQPIAPPMGIMGSASATSAAVATAAARRATQPVVSARGRGGGLTNTAADGAAIGGASADKSGVGTCRARADGGALSPVSRARVHQSIAMLTASEVGHLVTHIGLSQYRDSLAGVPMDGDILCNSIGGGHVNSSAHASTGIGANIDGDVYAHAETLLASAGMREARHRRRFVRNVRAWLAHGLPGGVREVDPLSSSRSCWL